MALWRRLDATAIVLLSFGMLFLVGGTLALVLFPGTTYHTTVEPAEPDEVGDLSYVPQYEFEELSQRGKAVFLIANTGSSDTAVLDDHDRTPPEFRYPTDTVGYQFVEYRDDYFLVRTVENGCLAALCTVARVLFAVVALAGLGCLWFGRRRIGDQ